MGKMSDPDDPVTKIAMRLSQVVEGEEPMHVASAASSLIAFAIIKTYKSKKTRYEALEIMIDFMVKMVEKENE